MHAYIYIYINHLDDTHFNKYKKGATLFKNRQTSDNLLTFALNCNDERVKREQLI